MRLGSLGLSLGEWQNLDVLFCHCWTIKGSYQLPGSLSTAESSVWSWDTFESSETIESQWIPWTYHSDQSLQRLISVSFKPEVNLGRSHVWYLDPPKSPRLGTQHRPLLSKLYQPNMTILKFLKNILSPSSSFELPSALESGSVKSVPTITSKTRSNAP